MNILIATVASIVLLGDSSGIWSPSHPELYPDPLYTIQCEDWHPPLIYPEMCYEEMD